MGKRVETTEHLREILKRTEIKRVSERITKKELCNIFGFSYTYYINSISTANKPSKKMIEDMQVYLEMPVTEVYERIFQVREIEETFHKKLELTEAYVNYEFEELKENGNYRLKEFERNTLVESVIEQEEQRRIEAEKKRLEEERKRLEAEEKAKAEAEANSEEVLEEQ